MCRSSRDAGVRRVDRFLHADPVRAREPASQPRDVVLTPKAWRDLVQVNTWVKRVDVVAARAHAEPTTGDCQQFVLDCMLGATASRKLATNTGWRRQPTNRPC